MQNAIKEYIEKEKEFSRFKIKTIEKTTNSYKARLLKKERDFLDFNFASVSYDDLQDCREAINLFKLSKKDFFLKFGLRTADSIKDLQLKFIRDKVLSLSVTGVGEIDNFKFKSLLGKDIFKSDGSTKTTYSKVLNICKSILLFIYDYIQSNGVAPDNVDDVFKNIDILDGQIDSYFYRGIRRLTMQEFDSIVHKTEKTSLIIFNMPHKGNEKINIIGCKIVDNNGKIITPKKFRFVSCSRNNSYYKSIILRKEDTVSLNMEKSIFFVGKSRRFMEHFLEAKVWARLIKIHLDEII